MKYCVFILANYNHPLLEKSLLQLIRYTTPKVKKYILLNNATEAVKKVAEKYRKNFIIYEYQDVNVAGLAIDHFLTNNHYDFYFKLDEDVMVATPEWDKRLFLSYLNYPEKVGFISCMIPNHNYNWSECVKIMGLEKEFRQQFPYDLENYQKSNLFKKNTDLIKYLLKNNINNVVNDPQKMAGIDKEFLEENLLKILDKVDKSSYYNSPVIYDTRLTIWLWKEVLKNKLKPVNRLIRARSEFYINLIGFERKLWQEIGSLGFDDERAINNYCFAQNLPIIADYSVIAHHFSYRIQYEKMEKELYPLIRERVF